ncbi:MAG: carbohydrate ABC transporter permease [Oscillospiraceae bacterium]|jgi:multiple sugar transport system permease protein|nr:carbohydrate ABC transporter permease [Oscillospiraceae bacterium]
MSRKRNKTSSSVSERVIGDFAGRPIRVIIVVISLIAILFPLYWLIANSLRTKTDYLANPPILFNAPVTFQNYQKILVENGIYKQFANTFVVAAVSTIIAVVFGSMAAYSTVRGRIAKKIRNFFGLWFMIQKMYPAIATAIPVYLVMRHLRLIDTRFALIIMNTSFNLPLVIWLMMGFFEQIPLELEESAKIDGANFVQRFFRIVFPVTTPGIIASAILAFVGAWNEFLFAVILSVNRSKTLPVVIAGFITDRGLEWGPMAATAVITLLPILVVVWALQKNFVQGLAMGAVKG